MLDTVVMVFATAAAVLAQAVRPATWRRPVRAEFWRFLELVCVRNLAPMLVAAVLVGLALVAQALYWLEQVGQLDAIRDVIVFVLVREIGPLIVGLIVLGTGGLLLVGEISTLRGTGQLAALDSQGVDPFQLLVVPRVVAITLAVFAHSVLFIMTALLVGYTMARGVGATTTTPLQFLSLILTGVGAIGYAVIPAKGAAIGLIIGAVCSLTALGRDGDRIAPEKQTVSAFLRAISGILLASALLSMVL